MFLIFIPHLYILYIIFLLAMDSQKLKKENESLKKELKQLNDQLNKILEKVQAKPHLG